MFAHRMRTKQGFAFFDSFHAAYLELLAAATAVTAILEQVYDVWEYLAVRVANKPARS